MALPQLTFDLMDALDILGPLVLIIGGITLYGVFVFNFYRFVARKDIISLDLQRHNQARHAMTRKILSLVFYVIRFLVIYPVFVFFWFCVMAGLLYVLSRNQTIDTVMLVGMGVVGAIRVSSYYSEALSTDIAKILPFALLGTMIVDSSVTRILESTEGVQDAALSWETVVYYLVAVVALESVLRVANGIFRLLRRRPASDDLQESTEAAQPGPAAPQQARDDLQASPESPAPDLAAATAAPGSNGMTVIRPRS